MKAFRPARDRAALRRLGWTVLALMLLTGGAIALLWTAPFLRVNSVDYRTADARMATLREAAPVRTGQPLVEVDTSSVRDDALATGLFSSVTVTRAWPSTIVVQATPRTPALGVRSSQGIRLVDAEGVPFETVATAPEGLPVASAPRSADPTALRALASVVTGLTPELAGSMDELRMDSAGIIRMDIGKVAVTWGDARDNRLKTAVVRDLVRRADVARIDVSAPLTPVTSAQREPSTWAPAAAASTGPSGSPPQGETGTAEASAPTGDAPTGVGTGGGDAAAGGGEVPAPDRTPGGG